MAAQVWETHRGQAQVSQDGTVTFSRTFRLNTDDPSARPAWGVASIAINKYDSHPDDATCLAVEVTSTPIDGELGWFDLQYTYTNKPFDVGVSDTGSGSGTPGSQDPTVQPNPTLRTPVVKWGSNTRMVPFTRDFDPNGRKPVANSAKQPYEGLEVEVCTTVITVSFAKGLIDITAKQAAYQNKVNTALFKIIPAHGGYAAGTLRCNNWTGSYQFEAGYGWYTQCEVEFEYNPEGWTMDVLDQGFYEHFNNGVEYVEQKFVNKTTGMPVDSPQKLNGAGRKLNPGDNPAVGGRFFVEGGGGPNVSVYQKFWRYDEANFANIFA